jgi:hypothetical protein
MPVHEYPVKQLLKKQVLEKVLKAIQSHTCMLEPHLAASEIKCKFPRFRHTVVLAG